MSTPARDRRILLRRCPLCDHRSALKLCPIDQTATLLAEPPSGLLSEPEAGTIVADRYVLDRVIGRGASSTVYEARHTGTAQRVAVKILKQPARSRAEVSLKRFFLEARVTHGFTHPNTIRVFDFGQDDAGWLYIAMELLSGRTLRGMIHDRASEQRTFTEREAIEIGIAVAKGLSEAHAAGLVHRDLKPENIFMHRLQGDDILVKVLDFGVAKLTTSTEDLTLARVIGTPAYMSPEQVLDLELDGRSDLYALGLILSELVTGRRAFAGRDPVEVAYARVRGAPPNVREHAQVPLSDQFVAAIERAVQRYPEDRFRDTTELRAALEACRETHAPVSTPTPRAVTLPLAEVEDQSSLPIIARRDRSPIPIAIAVAIAIAIAAAFGFERSPPSDDAVVALPSEPPPAPVAVDAPPVEPPAVEPAAEPVPAAPREEPKVRAKLRRTKREHEKRKQLEALLELRL